MENTQPQPTHKKEIKKAWLFTIILHLFIAGVLITYWYFNQSKKPDPVATNLQPTVVTTQTLPVEDTPLPPLKTELASVTTPTAQVASTATPTTTRLTASVATVTTTAIAPVTPTENTKNKPNMDKERPLSKYINAQTPTTQPPTTNKAVAEPATQTNNKQKLTARDIPRNEMPQPTNTPKPKVAQQELTKLNKEVEEDNDKISKLIEQVKNQNQRKINENVAKNTALAEKSATKTENPVEKPTEKAPPSEDKSQPTNSSNPS